MKRQLTLFLVAMLVALLMASGAALATGSTKEQTAKESTTQAKSTPTAPDAQAKKRHHHHHRVNTVQCPNSGNTIECFGTKSRDRLIGQEGLFDSIEGKGGDDIYDGKGGSDSYFDRNENSNDLFLVPSSDFGDLFIEDDGGSSDVLDLSAYKSTDFTYSTTGFPSKELLMTGAGTRDIRIFAFFDKNTIDTFKFSDGNLTAKQIKQKV